MTVSKCLLSLFALTSTVHGLGASNDVGATRGSATRTSCVVKAGGSNETDDVPAIEAAFAECGHGGRVVFSNTTYYVNSVMNITGLSDVVIDVYGTLLWSINITYWLSASLPVGYQNQSTAFLLGGDRITLDGHGGAGTLDGNGDVWYAFAKGTSNYPRRPHQITPSRLTNSVVRGLRFVRSQMWTMSMIGCENVLLEDVYVNNTASSGGTSSNTDGADTIYSSRITFSRWTVINGDDSISLKANSTDILVTNCTFINGLGLAMGSIGQYDGVFETIEHVYASNIVFHNTLHAVYFKTWTGDQVGYPPNGGGGGLGYASDLVFTDLTSASKYRGVPLVIGQCTSFSGVTGNCTNSEFHIRDIAFGNLTGVTGSANVASFQCSAVAPCEDIAIWGVDLVYGSVNATGYLCENVMDPVGWSCTGDM